jgi:hypothetical protein
MSASGGQIAGPVPPCEQGDHAGDGDGPGQHRDADPRSSGKRAAADGATSQKADAKSQPLAERSAGAAATGRLGAHDAVLFVHG